MAECDLDLDERQLGSLAGVSVTHHRRRQRPLARAGNGRCGQAARGSLCDDKGSADHGSRHNSTSSLSPTHCRDRKSFILYRCGAAEGLLASQNGVFRGAALGSERVRAALGSDGEFALR